MSIDTLPIIKGNETCEYWESSEDTGTMIIPMRECWYCKYSDFRKHLNETPTFSLCHFSTNNTPEPNLSSDRRNLCSVKLKNL
jgi:hypothetical protein